jgi:hypothetical protein
MDEFAEVANDAWRILQELQLYSFISAATHQNQQKEDYQSAEEEEEEESDRRPKRHLTQQLPAKNRKQRDYARQQFQQQQYAQPQQHVNRYKYLF